ncbi:hypothetical protein AAFF_G00303080 [Aldrovandia affinis]|uniref:ATP-grasp domain-containing protein n=1 Tax=Aldrovandia affinis TaxID=143900 RepID=A0AAD7R845_9TELE|nr:hypothetical protein AAFF_G00303080 [Aldrovandia affinis]
MLSLSSLSSSVFPSCPIMLQEDISVIADPVHQERVLFQTLQEVLEEIGLPKTQDWACGEAAPGECYSDLCICVLGSPLPYLSLLLEAGQISPGDSLLCLSSTWVSRSSSSLVVHRAVTFDLGGRTTLLTFSPPRRVTYLLTCDPWAGQEVTRGIECPMGGSLELGQSWGDTLAVRILLQRAKINCPPTLALLLPPGRKGVEEGRTGVVEVILLDTEGAQRGTASVRNRLTTFLESGVFRQTDRVVLRRSGAEPGDGVVCLPRGGVWARVTQLLPLLLPGEAILVEAYCPPLRPGPRVEDRTWEQYSDCRPQAPDLSFRVCATVTRSPQNVPLLYKLECKIGAEGSPLSRSLSQSLETTMSDLGFSDSSVATSLRRLATDTALACLRVVMETESEMSPEQRGGAGAQSDMIGVDLLFTLSDSVISPCYLMRGKSVLVIGAGGFSKKFVWEAAEQYGLKILLVDSDPSHFASRLVDHFFPLPDLPDHRRDDQHCARICEWVCSVGPRPDGCVCFWDDCVVLASLVCRALGLRGPPPEAVHIAKEKSRTHLHLLGLEAPGPAPQPPPEEGGVAVETEGESPRATADLDRREQAAGNRGDGGCHHDHGVGGGGGSSSSSSSSSFRPSAPRLSPSPGAYAVPCAHVESGQDLKDAVRHGAVRFPAVMKLEYGAGAVGVKRVDSPEEGLAHMEKIAGDLREETDYPGIGLGWGNAMTLMEFVGGTEHDVDVVLFAGRLEGAFVSDNGPTRTPSFTETAAQMPTGLPADKREQLIRAAHHSCLGCGLRDGVFNVELKMTALGPRLVEINARMGGFYLRDWILQLYGVDILLAAFMVACGLAPRLPSAAGLPPRGAYVGVMCVVSQHLQALRTTARPERLRRLHQEGALRLNELEDELIAGEYEEPYCNVGVRDERPADARRRLLALCQGLGLHCPPRYNVGYFLSHFK